MERREALQDIGILFLAGMLLPKRVLAEELLPDSTKTQTKLDQDAVDRIDEYKVGTDFLNLVNSHPGPRPPGSRHTFWLDAGSRFHGEAYLTLVRTNEGRYLAEARLGNPGGLGYQVVKHTSWIPLFGRKTGIDTIVESTLQVKGGRLRPIDCAITDNDRKKRGVWGYTGNDPDIVPITYQLEDSLSRVFNWMWNDGQAIVPEDEIVSMDSDGKVQKANVSTVKGRFAEDGLFLPEPTVIDGRSFEYTVRLRGLVAGKLKDNVYMNLVQADIPRTSIIPVNAFAKIDGLGGTHIKLVRAEPLYT